MNAFFDKPTATRAARNLASHLKSAHGLELNHQTALTALAHAFGHRSLNEMTAAMKAAPAAGKPDLSGASSDALLAELRSRGQCIQVLGAEKQAEPAQRLPDDLPFLDTLLHVARSAIDQRVATGAAPSLTMDELIGLVQLHCPDVAGADVRQSVLTLTERGELLMTADRRIAIGGNAGTYPPGDLPDDQIANAGMGWDRGEMPANDIPDRAIEQCNHRSIFVDRTQKGWTWAMPDSKNPAKREPTGPYPSEGAAALAACAAFGIDPTAFCVLNHYHCDQCGEGWEDPWFSSPDDECPACGADIEPYESESLVHKN